MHLEQRFSQELFTMSSVISDEQVEGMTIISPKEALVHVHYTQPENPASLIIKVNTKVQTLSVINYASVVSTK